jgi:hypothetical protein
MAPAIGGHMVAVRAREAEHVGGDQDLSTQWHSWQALLT